MPRRSRPTCPIPQEVSEAADTIKGSTNWVMLADEIKRCLDEDEQDGAEAVTAIRNCRSFAAALEVAWGYWGLAGVCDLRDHRRGVVGMPQTNGVGLRRDAHMVIVRLLRTTASARTAAQIVARTGFSHSPTARHLADLASSGQVGRLAGRPTRWYWRADNAEAAAD